MRFARLRQGFVSQHVSTTDVIFFPRDVACAFPTVTAMKVPSWTTWETLDRAKPRQNGCLGQVCSVSGSQSSDHAQPRRLPHAPLESPGPRLPRAPPGR